MVTTVGSQGTVVYGNQAQVTFNGFIFGVTTQWEFKNSFKQDEEAVVGTPYPIITTGAFSGTGSLTCIFATDYFQTNSTDWTNIFTPTAGQVGPINMVFAGADISGTKGAQGNHGRLFTFTGLVWPTDADMSGKGTDKVILKMSFKFSGLPTET